MSSASDPSPGGGEEAAREDESRDETGWRPSDLPEEAQRRVARFVLPALQALPETQVPGPLRFARRWSSGKVPQRLVGPILGALEQDAAFAEDVRRYLLTDGPDAADRVEADDPPGDADPFDRAAWLFLLRPDGWRERVSSLVLEAQRASDGPAGLVQARREIEALRGRLARARERRDRDVAAAKQAEAEARSRLDQETQRLRRQLGDAQRSLREQEDALQSARDREGELDREVRRLRAVEARLTERIARHEASGRDNRVAASARAKALLAVLQGAAAGLAEELALPAATPDPADTVAATEPSIGHAATRILTPGDLGEALAMPGCHLLVDGYNVSKGMWPQAPLQQQRERLLTGLAALQSRTSAEITAVFDGAEVGPVPSASTRTVRVRFSPAGELADRVIVRMVAAEPEGRPIVVVSSDAALTSGARSAGARTADREVLAGLLNPAR